MLTSRRIVQISRTVDDHGPASDHPPACEETATQLRIDQLLRSRSNRQPEPDSSQRADAIIDSLRDHTPVHLRPRRFSFAPFIAVAATFLLAAVITHFASKPLRHQTAPIAELAPINTDNIISSPFVAEARLLAEDTSRAADAVFAYLPRLGE